MSQASLIRNLPSTLSQPIGVATLASLGIHGLFWVILPVLPLDPKPETHSQRTVGLVQLTPEELSRLPQAVTPQQTTPPPLPLQQQSNLPPLPPSPTYQPKVLPPLPPPPSFNLAPIPGSAPTNTYPISNSLPQQKTYLVPPPPPPTQNNQSFTARSPFDPLPTPPVPLPSYKVGVPQPPISNQASRIQNSLPPRRFILPPNRGLPNLALKPSTAFVPSRSANQTAQYRMSQPPTQQQNQPQNQQVATNPQIKQQTTSALPDKLPERGRQELLALQQQIRARRNQANQQSDRSNSAATPTASASTANTAEQQRQQNLVAALRSQQQLQSNTVNNSTRSQTANPVAQQRQQNLVATLRSQQQSQSNTSANTTSPQTTRTIAQLNEFQERYQEVQQANPNVKTKAPIREKIKTCEQQLAGRTAVFGVVFNPNGKIISGPEFIPKNSTADIQQAAKKYLSSYQPQKSDNPVDQSFRLDFQYGGSKCAKE